MVTQCGFGGCTNPATLEAGFARDCGHVDLRVPDTRGVCEPCGNRARTLGTSPHASMCPVCHQQTYVLVVSMTSL